MTYLDYCESRPEVPSDVQTALRLYSQYGTHRALAFARHELNRTQSAWWWCVVVTLKRLHLPWEQAVKVLH